MIATVPVELTDAALSTEVRAGLKQVEQQLTEATQAEEALLAEASTHLLEAGGKRFRATLVLLAGQFGDPADERVVRAATAIELTHLATLYHDDVMDEAPLRRGHQSANSRWTNTIAILTGDFLFARASQDPGRAGRGRGPDPGRHVHPAGQRAGGGDHRAAARPGSAAALPQVVTEKTASLVATAGRFGAMFSAAPADVVNRIEPACEAIGVAWQLSDDILDVASDTAESGKTPGTDLREGVRSLPVLHALRSSRPGDAGCVSCSTRPT